MSTIATPQLAGPRLARPRVAGPRVAGPRRIRVRWHRVAALLVALLVCAWLVVGVAAGSSQADAPPADPVTVVVTPGDTLWELARAHGPTDMATLEYVGLVEQANGVRAGALAPGTLLQLPQP